MNAQKRDLADDMIKPKVPYSESDETQELDSELEEEEEEAEFGEGAEEDLDEALNPTSPPTEDDLETMSLSDLAEVSPDEVENIQEEEIHAGLQSDDEEWEQELTGERPDNGYLPGQRLAEHGIDRENFPINP